MKFKIIKESLLALLEDAAEAENFLDENYEMQFARRTYIRSIFAGIEGTIWILKTTCFTAALEGGRDLLTVAEFALLKEESYELKNNGETSISTKFLRLADNLRFAFKTINKLFSVSIDLAVGTKEWNDFLQAIEIRNRITHPKSPESFIITNIEIEACKNASSWFNDLTENAIDAFIKNNAN